MGVLHTSRVGVAGGKLYIAQRDAGVQSGHDESGAQNVRMDPLEPGLLADRACPPERGAGVETVAVVAQQDRSLAAFTDRQIDRASRSGHEWDAGCRSRDRSARLHRRA